MTTVLVVDDDNVYRTFLSVGLTRHGYHVLVAATGREAMHYLRNAAVSALVTDIFMPDTDGIELILAAKRAQPDLRVVAVSGGSARFGRDFLDCALRLGADAVLSKPLSCSDLALAIGDLTGRGVTPPAQI